MKKIALLLSGIVSLSATSQIVNIPDANFKAYLVGNTAINTNLDTEIQVSEANAYTGPMSCYSMSISDLTGIEAFTQITYLSCYGNTLTALNVSQNTLLTSLLCNANYSIATLDLSANTALTHLECNHNALTSLDLSNNPALSWVFCYTNPLTVLNLANGNNTNLTLFNATYNPSLTCIQVDNVAWSTSNWTSPTSIDATASFSTSCNYPCIVNIPDANFKTYLVGNSAINTNLDTEIQCSEASAFTGTIDCNSLAISDLTGIESFTALTDLQCNDNDLITLDVTQNTALTILVCHNNFSLTTLDVSQNTALTELKCDYNNMTALDVTQNTALINLKCSYQLITTLDLTQNTALEVLSCRYNSLTTLNLSQNTALVQLICNNNTLSALDLTQAPSLSYLSCYSNDLSMLDVSNGNNSSMATASFNATSNPNLTCIQVDDAVYSTTNWTNIDAGASFSENCSSVGIDELPNQEIQIFPNPASSHITISTVFELEEILIFDLFGSLIQVENAKTISVENLPSGIYIMQVKTTKGLIRKRFVKE
ncbi:MAG: T9SS type A sorting domain-containing protein [Crocinitomicaceae bacterium]|nr:T9SS type A sorting domain-containing protein [Flavobacteriales bacterium]NQZ38191.1 T9SS type A sorting domain-containing protein [Crocinitomicaceae bacterium]